MLIVCLCRAEDETQAKQDKVKKIRRLANQIAQLESQNSKDDEKLQEYLTYKAFLDKLAPREHQETIRRMRQERKVF